MIKFIFVIISFITVCAGVLFVHQPGANHAPRASVNHVNHSVHTLSTFLSFFIIIIIIIIIVVTIIIIIIIIIRVFEYHELNKVWGSDSSKEKQKRMPTLDA